MKRVLILENDEAVLDVMKEALTYEGFEVCSVRETDNIFLLIDEYKPDAILIDYLLNGINGGEICDLIKTNSQTADLPVIITSAYPRVFGPHGSQSCDDFIPKPFDLDDLACRIKKLTDKNLHVF